MTGKRTTVGLVFGGASGEHHVSIRSARTVLTGLTQGENRDRYAVIPVYIDRDGRWWGEAIAQAVLVDGAEADPRPQPLPEAGFRGLPRGTETVEIWYPVLHGPNGEDGTVQGLFRLMGKPFVLLLETFLRRNLIITSINTLKPPMHCRKKFSAVKGSEKS